MKNQIITALLILLSAHVHAQEDIQIDFGPIQLSETEVDPAFQAQLFTHGSDSIWLTLHCNRGSLFGALSAVHSNQEGIQIIDSLDLNEDSIPELILYHEWSCSTPGDITNEFGVGSSSERIGQYEVWDVKNNRKLFEFRSSYWYQYIVSTNVVHGSSYNYDVTFDSNGNLRYVQTTGLQEGKENKGVWKYDRKSGTYILQ